MTPRRPPPLFVFVFVFGAQLFVAARAHAAEPEKTSVFGVRAANVITLDALAGVFRETVVTPDATPSDEGGAIVFGTHAGPAAFGETARLGFHRFVVPWLTVGAGVHVSSSDSQDRFPHGGTIFGVAPRVGFVFGTSTYGAFWLRVGAQYFHHSYADDLAGWDVGPGAELLFVWTPYAHFGVTVGPMMEIDVAGSVEQRTFPAVGEPQTTSTRVRRRTFGLALGFVFDV